MNYLCFICIITSISLKFYFYTIYSTVCMCILFYLYTIQYILHTQYHHKNYIHIKRNSNAKFIIIIIYFLSSKGHERVALGSVFFLFMDFKRKGSCFPILKKTL